MSKAAEKILNRILKKSSSARAFYAKNYITPKEADVIIMQLATPQKVWEKYFCTNTLRVWWWCDETQECVFDDPGKTDVPRC